MLALYCGILHPPFQELEYAELLTVFYQLTFEFLVKMLSP